MESMTGIAILNKTVRLDGEGIADFAKEIKKLSDADKAELVKLGAAHLNVTVADGDKYGIA